MTLEDHLKKIDEVEIHNSWTPSDIADYMKLQNKFAKDIFMPLLAHALDRPLTRHEAGIIYNDVGSGSFAKLYIFYQKYRNIGQHNPVYVAGKFFLIEAYAKMSNLTESQAAVSLLDRGLFEEFDVAFSKTYNVIIPDIHLKTAI